MTAGSMYPDTAVNISYCRELTPYKYDRRVNSSAGLAATIEKSMQLSSRPGVSDSEHFHASRPIKSMQASYLHQDRA
jgi:hypothetical protein